MCASHSSDTEPVKRSTDGDDSPDAKKVRTDAEAAAIRAAEVKAIITEELLGIYNYFDFPKDWQPSRPRRTRQPSVQAQQPVEPNRDEDEDNAFVEYGVSDSEEEERRYDSGVESDISS